MTIKLKGYFKNRQPSSDRYLGEGRWDISEGDRFVNILEMLPLSEQEAGIVFINGIKANKEQVLREGDTVEIFSPLSGG